MFLWTLAHLGDLLTARQTVTIDSIIPIPSTTNLSTMDLLASLFSYLDFVVVHAGGLVLDWHRPLEPYIDVASHQNSYLCNKIQILLHM